MPKRLATTPGGVGWSFSWTLEGIHMSKLRPAAFASLIAALVLAAACTGKPPGPTTETTPAGNSAGQTSARPSTAR
jgi:hypothetical protein